MAGLARFVALGAVAALAIYSAYVNAHDEAVSEWLRMRAIVGWTALPTIMLVVYITSMLLSKNSKMSFTPVMTLITAYAIVFGYCALNSPDESSRASYTHLIFVPMILGVFSLPFFVFLVDRNVSMIRRRLRGEEPIHGRHPQETR